jgi:protein gp37
MVFESGSVAVNGMRYLPRNVWLGATIVDQAEAARDIPKLLAAKAALGASVAFLSMEPLLGPVDLLNIHQGAAVGGGGRFMSAFGTGLNDGVDWVIVGGESGGRVARPMHPDWAYALQSQCEHAGVPFLFKQWGEWANPGCPVFGKASPLAEVRHIDRMGRFVKPSQDEDADCLTIVRVGKAAAGRQLGGQHHDGYPEARP